MNRIIRLCAAALLFAGVASARADTLRLDAERAVELALRNNNQVRLALARLDESASGRAVAFGQFLPQLSGSGAYTRLGTVNSFYMARESLMPLPVFDSLGQLIGQTAPTYVPVGLDTLELGGRNNFVLRASAQQTLFTWGKLINAYRIAGLTLDMQKAALVQARAQVRVDATAGFYQALLAEKTAALMRESYAQLERHVGQAQALYDNGLASKLDVLRAQVGLVNMEAQVSQVENGRDLALAALRNTIGVPRDVPLVLDDSLKPDSMTVDLEPAIDSALARRPELTQLRHACQMADLGVRVERTANLPSLFTAFNYDYKRPVGFSDKWGTDWNLTAGLSMPIFTGLSNWNKLKQAQSRYRQARFGLAMAEDGIRLDVQASVSSLNQEAKNIAYQSRNVRVAEEALALAETRYQNGLLTNLEYMDTQLALTQSRVSYLSSLANYRIAKAKLLQAMGITEER